MTKYIIGALVFIILIVIGFVLLSPNGILGKKTSVTINNTKISLDVADTPKKREVGLSSRRSLSENQGMLFVFDKQEYPTFWMKGMSFPIDIIFLNKEKVVTIYKNVPNPSNKTDIPTATYTPTAPADRVIELKTGMVDKLNIRIGDTITIPL